MIENAELEAIKAIVDYGSVIKASVRLHRVQSSISFRIKSLESKLGVKLFERSGRRIVVTSAGKDLYGYACEILNLLGKAEVTLGLSRKRKKICLGVIENFSLVRQSLLQKIVNNSMGLDIDLVLGNTTYLTGLLESGACDAAIVGAGVAPEYLSRIALFEENLVLISGPLEAPVSLQNLDGCSFLVSSKQSASQRNLSAFLAHYHVTPQRIIECGSYPLLFSQVARGVGFSLVPEALVELFSGTYDVRRFELQGPYAKFNTELVFLDSSPDASVRKLARWIVEGEGQS